MSIPYVPAYVSPTTARNTTPAAAVTDKMKKLRNSERVKKDCTYRRAPYAFSRAKTPIKTLACQEIITISLCLLMFLSINIKCKSTIL